MSYETVRFSDVTGLSQHIARLEEQVILPFQSFSFSTAQPGSACLFYGPMGTGKRTLMHALINECIARQLNVQFVMKNCERFRGKSDLSILLQIQKLFKEVNEYRPCIFFLNNIEELFYDQFPVLDHKYRYVEKELIKRLDDMKNRIGLVLIAATCKFECLDKALIRPGRFDQIFHFELPNKKCRLELLKTALQVFPVTFSSDALQRVADEFCGFSGLDIYRVLFSVVFSARKRCLDANPERQVFVEEVKSKINDEDLFTGTSKTTVPALDENSSLPVEALPTVVRPLLENKFAKAVKSLQQVFPLTKAASAQDEIDGPNENMKQKKEAAGPLPHDKIFQEPPSYRPIFILSGRPCSGKTTYIIPALLHALGNLPVFTLDVVELKAHLRPPEHVCIQVFRAAKKAVPSVLCLPGFDYFWKTASPHLKAVFIRLVRELDPSLPLLMLASCDSDPFVPLFLLAVRDADEDLPAEILGPFPETGHPCICKVELPSREEREMFFQQLFGLHSSKKKDTVCGSLVEQDTDRKDILQRPMIHPPDYVMRMKLFHTIMEKTNDWDFEKLESIYNQISFCISAYENNFLNLELLQAVEEILVKFFRVS